MIRPNNDFTKSLLGIGSPFVTTEYALDWIREQNQKVQVNVEQTSFKDLKKWKFEEGALRHDSGKFFSIEGLDVKTNYGKINSWQQPIINQPEIGYLGFITKEINGVLHFLMQAKIEPGNINFVQLSPTLQATKSNYSRVHQGHAPAYLEFFQKAKKEHIILDQLQSEQGARFLKKRNRNIIIKVEEEIEVLDNFLWLTLAQIKELMKEDNVVNMDTRTVISGIPLGDFTIESVEMITALTNRNFDHFSESLLKSSAHDAPGYNSLNDIILFVTRHKADFELDVQKVPLEDLQEWRIGDHSIYHEDHKYFEVIAANISIGNREVVNWSQPMVKPVQEGICAFVCKNFNGILHFAVQVKLECGNFDIIEFAPTVQCLTDNYRTERSLKGLPFLEYVLNAENDKVIYDSYQSEEGGRFYREQNRNIIVFGGEEIPDDLPSNHIWMTHDQLHTFMKHNNYINIQARSLLSAINLN